jgi:hypothetical protein
MFKSHKHIEILAYKVHYNCVIDLIFNICSRGNSSACHNHEAMSLGNRDDLRYHIVFTLF